MLKSEVLPYMRTQRGSRGPQPSFLAYKGQAVDAGLAFLLSCAPVFGSFVPFGLSYYAATFQTSGWLLKLLAVGLGCLITVGPVLTLKYLIPLMLYTLVTVLTDFQKTYIKALTLSGMLLLANVVLYVFSGFILYDIVVGVVESFLCFVGVFVAQKAEPLLKTYHKRTAIAPEELISITAVFGVMVLSLSRIPPIAGLNVSNILSITLILMLCLKGELGMGAAVGVIVGLINGISNYNMSAVIGAFSFSALVAGLFKPFGKVGVCLGFILANSVITIFLNSSTEVLISVYDIISASLLFFLLPDKVVSYFTAFSGKTVESNLDVVRRGEEMKDVVEKRMHSASSSLKGLSDMYFEISEQDAQYDKKDMIALFDSCSKKVCADCGLKYVCWQKDYQNSYQQMFQMLASAEQTGQLRARDLPEKFKERCSKREAFLVAFNHMYEIYKMSKLWRSKIIESRNVAARQLKDVADIIDGISESVCIGVDVELENAIATELDKHGILTNYIWVIVKDAEQQRFEITISIKNYKTDMEYLAQDAIVDVTGFGVRIGKICKTDGEMVVKFFPKEKYSLSVGVAQVNKAGEKECGDSYMSICLNGGGHVLAISDGMGSGSVAAKESRSVMELLEGFFEAGFETDAALNLINSALLLKTGSETFSTVDLASIDLCEGNIRFVKIGGSTSFIKTGSKVERILFSSLPIGVMMGVDKQTCVRRVQNETMLVMVSDGIIDSAKDGDDTWITRLLGETVSYNPQTIANIVLKKALENCGGKACDDMTVMAARVWE